MRHEPAPATGGGVPASAVRAQLMRLLQSRSFARAARLRRFLTYAVDEVLAGRFERLKEYALGVDVFDRGDGFDPRADPIVRVDARRLRRAIEQYYAGEGADDPVKIELPTGSYMPVFRLLGGTPVRARAGVRLAAAPFEAPAQDAAALAFAEGLTDELLLALTGCPDLQVIAAQRAEADPAALIARLGAEIALTGKVRRVGQAWRVRAALTAADGTQVWAERYDADPGDVGSLLQLQDALAAQIAGVVAPRVAPPRRAPARTPTADVEAYDLYLRGRRLLNATRPELLGEAMRLLEAAAARDSSFAEAQAALAEAHILSAIFVTAPPVEAYATARGLASAALATAPDLTSGLLASAQVSAGLDHDFQSAGALYEQALAEAPSSAMARRARAFWQLAPLGRLDEAATELAELLEHDPYSLRLRFDYARVLHFQRKFDDAVRHLELILEFEPNFPGAVFALAFAFEHAGRLEEAREAHGRHVQQLPYPLVTRWLELAQAGWDGAPALARDIAHAMEADAANAPLAATVMADAWLRVGEPARALAWLERAADQRLYRVLFLAVDPSYAALAGETGFSALAARLGLA